MNRSRLGRGVGRVGVTLVIVCATACSAHGQDLEPRAYADTPVGLNFLIAGYGYSQGDVAFDASSPIEDAELQIHFTSLAYVRSLDLWGRSGKLDVVLPYAWASGTAKLAGQSREREISGLADPRFRVSALLYGGPALSLAEYAAYKPDLIVGVSLAVTAPLGQYEADKLVNLGTNRWSVKPELGIAKTLGPWTLELTGSVTFYTKNDEFLGGQTLTKEPTYAVQGHLIYLTRVGIWAALDATYYWGGRTTVDGERGDQPENLRLGASLSIPVDRRNSVKLYGSTGAIARVGGSFNTVGIAWQYRWGGGL